MSKSKKRFKITDWACNELNLNKKFFSVPMEFKSFDDAEEYLIELLGESYEEDRGDYYIEECEVDGE